MLWLLAAGVLLAGESGVALAQSHMAGEAVERVGLGQVNWTTGWIKATGVGVAPADGGPGARLKAERAGYVVALRNLLEIVKGVRVDGESVTDAYLVKNDVIRTQVSGFIQGAQIVKTVAHPDGTVDVTVKMPVWGSESLVSALLNEKAMQSYTLSPEADTKQGYTGIVIDARGMGVNPACFPEVLDETGVVVYGPGTVDRTAAEKNGLWLPCLPEPRREGRPVAIFPWDHGRAARILEVGSWSRTLLVRSANEVPLPRSTT